MTLLPIVEKLARFINEKRPLFAFVMLAIIPIIGTAGYMLVEGWSMFDALYMTTITMTTIGYGETHPLSHNGRIFTIVFIIVGVGIAAYSLSILVEALLRPELISNGILKRKLRKMNHHYIICGYGRSGSRIARELRSLGKPFVIVEQNASVLNSLSNEGFIAVIGDATNEEILLKAGIERAEGIAISLDNDAANIFVTLTARGLNPDVYIVARADEFSSQSKLKRAGADAVLSPQEIGAVRMTHMLLQQNVIDSFELVTRRIALDVSVKELQVADYPQFIGQTIEQLRLVQRFNVIVFALKLPDETVQFPAQAKTVLEQGMTLILAGVSDDMMRLTIA
ncbi:MAG: potassium channel protein [Candidatus Kapabacteria bacterium]|jgi:voltage-gated potassium channel|nr:potassium channel protein [Candidatus Kapabacteria bacterium]